MKNEIIYDLRGVAHLLFTMLYTIWLLGNLRDKREKSLNKKIVK